MRIPPSLNARAILLVCFFHVSLCCFGVTLEELENEPEMTPRKFAAYFRDFDFHFRREVQSPEVFLATRSGDCDDFSTLAASILRARGYTPRLITVRMPGVTHVVCYIEETKSYLDYNNRIFLDRTVSSRPEKFWPGYGLARRYSTRPFSPAVIRNTLGIDAFW